MNGIAVKLNSDQTSSQYDEDKRSEVFLFVCMVRLVGPEEAIERDGRQKKHTDMHIRIQIIQTNTSLRHIHSNAYTDRAQQWKQHRCEFEN